MRKPGGRLLAAGLISFWLVGCFLVNDSIPQTSVAPPSPQDSQETSVPNPTPTRSTSSPAFRENLLAPPPSGKLYHGVYPGGITGEEDDLTVDDLHTYENLAGKQAVWVYFSDNWYHGREFPVTTTTWIRAEGSIPYIRLMPRSDAGQNQADPVYDLASILEGDFDSDLHTWFAAASQFQTPLLVEYGTEMNGEWFPWNGVWNGGAVTDQYGDPAQPDGPERFRDVYRHLVNISRQEGALNITWVFHVNYNDSPEESWNALENYYPGEEWVDWLAVSVYGAQTPLDDYWEEFRPSMDSVYARVAGLDATKPVLVAEFGVTRDNPLGDQADWAQAALQDLTNFRWPRVIGFSWWNEYWQNDENPNHDTHMRLQDNPELAQVFQNLVGGNPNVLSRVVVTSTTQVSLPLILEQQTPAGIWHPAPQPSWQWQLSGLPVDTSVVAQVYDLDLFDTETSLVETLHDSNHKLVCYISVGSWEDWRSDKDDFPAEVIGNDYSGWPGEKWLDIRRLDLLAPILRARLDLCQAKGFDGVEPDNVDSYLAKTGFPISYQDQIQFNRWIASEAHLRGLSVGLKNDGEQVSDLLSDFDWALTEDCVSDGWCVEMLPFIQAGKAVISTEYTDRFISKDQFCPQLNSMNYFGIFKHRDLDAWRESCQ